MKKIVFAVMFLLGSCAHAPAHATDGFVMEMPAIMFESNKKPSRTNCFYSSELENNIKDLIKTGQSNHIQGYIQNMINDTQVRAEQLKVFLTQTKNDVAIHLLDDAVIESNSCMMYLYKQY